MPQAEVPAVEAARRLGVQDSRVRALVAAGALAARKVANRWLVDAGALERRLARPRRRGRPLEAANAWGLLFLASGEAAPWLAGDVRSRLRKRLRERSLGRDMPRLAGRARVHYFAGGERARRRLLALPRFVRSGLSAAADYGAKVRSPEVLEGYLPAADLRTSAYRLALREVDEPEADLILREVSGLWPFEDRSVAPAAVVAADLLDSADGRTRRAGEALLRGIAV